MCAFCVFNKSTVFDISLLCSRYYWGNMLNSFWHIKKRYLFHLLITVFIEVELPFTFTIRCLIFHDQIETWPSLFIVLWLLFLDLPNDNRIIQKETIIWLWGRVWCFLKKSDTNFEEGIFSWSRRGIGLKVFVIIINVK